MATGIEERHTRSCRSRKGGRCDCEPSYRASVWDGERERRIRQTFTSYAEAVGWRMDARTALRRGRQPQTRSSVTLKEAAEEWQRLAEATVIRTRKGEEFKPAALRAYERAVRLRVLPKYGHEALADLKRPDWQQLVDELLADGSAPATISTTIAAVACIYRHEVSRGRLKDNPLRGLDLPAVRNGRDHVVTPKAAGALLDALPESDRALWATAMYAGLRRGELRALRVSDVDLDTGIIHVERSVDDKQVIGETKGRTKRVVPIPSLLRQYLREHLMRTGHRDDDLLFTSSLGGPFTPTYVSRSADAVWEKAKLERITLHECRHTYASYMIAAGVNAKALSTFMGHSSITITLDRYGHLFPGAEDEAAELLDAYLTKAAG